MVGIIWAAAILLYVLLCIAVGRFLGLASIAEAEFQELIEQFPLEEEFQLEPELDEELVLKG